MRSEEEEDGGEGDGARQCAHSCRHFGATRSISSRTRLAEGRSSIMAEHESLEYGKADFVLLDTVSMEEFMTNLKLR